MGRPALVCLCCTFAVVIVVTSAQLDKYAGRLDNINVDEVLGNDRLLTNYYKCLMDQGRCTPEAANLKKLIPTAVEKKCGNCTPNQREQLKKAITYLRAHKPDYFKDLVAKYDPNETWKGLYE